MRVVLPKVAVESTSRSTNLPKVAVESTSRSTNFRENFAVQANPEAPIFRKICNFRKFLNRQISGKIRGFVRNFRKIWDFWHNCRMYWINSGYNCRVSDRGAHFFGRRPVLCNNEKNISIIYIIKFLVLCRR